MKSNYHIILLAGLSMLFSGCHGILDLNDPTAVNGDQVWSNEVLATAYLDKCYRDNMPGYNSQTANYSEESSGGGEFLYGQMLVEGGGSDNAPTHEYWPYAEIYRINIMLDNIETGTLSADVQRRLKAQALFLRAYRYFETVIRYGGVPYIKKAQDQTKDDLYVTRDKTSDCIQWIIDDLDEAINSGGLPSSWDTANFGRITKGAAMAFKGRVLMFWASKQFNRDNDRARWQRAYDANLAARTELEGPGGRGLNPDFAEIWKTTTRETIITTRFKYPSRTHNFEASARPLDLSQSATGAHHPTLNMVLAFPMSDGTAPGAMVGGAKVPFDPTATDASGLFWVNRDPRFYQTVVTNGSHYPLIDNQGTMPNPGGLYYTFDGYTTSQNASKTGFYSRKFIQTEKMPSESEKSDLDWIEMRHAEVLLNLAECAAEVGGKSTEVYQILKDIRARAGITANNDGMYGLKSGMSDAELVEAVVYEKQIELAYEGKRFWDLRRRMMFDDPEFDGYQRMRVRIARKSNVPATAVDFIASITTTGGAYDAEKAAENLNTTKYFDHFTTTLVRLDNEYSWNVPDNYYFFGLPIKHFEQNANLTQTKGWDGGTFDPLQ
jgi:hypothetical protein